MSFGLILWFKIASLEQCGYMLLAMKCGVSSPCSVTVVFIHMMEDDQRLNTLVHEEDTFFTFCEVPGILVITVFIVSD